jgi:molecular chaperone GrpE (heat shock protein)
MNKNKIQSLQREIEQMKEKYLSNINEAMNFKNSEKQRLETSSSEASKNFSHELKSIHLQIS